MSAPWWKPRLNEYLSQGDVVESVLFLAPHDPPTLLGRREEHKGSQWIEENAEGPVDANGRRRIVALCYACPALVVSHSCEIDKHKEKLLRGKKRILAAPVFTLASLNDEEQRDRVVARRSSAMFPLPGVATLGDCYVDFRRIMPIPAQALLGTQRLACMTEIATEELQKHLATFFTRLQ